MASATNQPIKVRVNRAFYFDGKALPVGAEVSIPPALAAELDGAGKIERADREPSQAHKAALVNAALKAERKGASAPKKG
jgi:hypothetical protein